MTFWHWGNRQSTSGCAADGTAVITFSEDKKLADKNAGWLNVEVLFDRTPILPMSRSRGRLWTFCDCGGLSILAAAFGLSGGGYSLVPK
jgi:hypothetical protein